MYNKVSINTVWQLSFSKSFMFLSGSLPYGGDLRQWHGAQKRAIEVNVKPRLPQRRPTTSRDATPELSTTKINRCKPIEVVITCTNVKMVYDWDSAKEETCYRMYIEEKRSLEEIMEYYKNQNFTPR